MHKSKLTARGQVVIPALLRKEMNLKPGQSFLIHRVGSKLVLTPDSDDPVSHGLGLWKTGVDQKSKEDADGN